MADTDTIINTEQGKLLPRLEKKSRQSLAKLGLKKVEGINRVVMRRPQGVLLAIDRPEVYRAGDCYIVFGEAKVEDPANGGGFGAQAMAAAQAAQARQEAEQARQAKAGGSSSGTQAVTGEQKQGVDPNDVFAGVGESSGSKADEPEADVDETGLDGDDIQTVMTQAKCSRGKAVQALKKHDGDLVNAIMSCQA